MQNVLADLCVESEAATVGDDAPRARLRRRRSDDGERPLRAPRHGGRASTGSASARRRTSAEALECLGGNGYVEESLAAAALPRGAAQRHLGGLGQRHLPRRAARHGREPRGRSRRSSPRSSCARGADPRLDAFVDDAARRAAPTSTRIEARARRLVERMALALQGSLLVRARRPRASPTPSAPRASPATTASPSARCRAGSTATRIIERARPVIGARA